MYHSRTEWQTASQPVSGIPFPGWGQIRYIVFHYPGADWADMDFDNDGDVDLTDSKFILRAMQNMYLTDPNRRYSLGYQDMVDVLGEEWQIRGFNFQNAANVGAIEKTGVVNWNPFTYSILVCQRGTLPATAPQIAGIRRRVAAIWAAAKREIPLSRHGQWDYTPCAGSGINTQLAAGVFVPVPVPPPPVSGGLPWSDDMARLIQPSDGDFAQFFTDGVHATSASSVEAITDAAAAGLIPSATSAKVPRRMLKALRLVGPLPNYTGSASPVKTVATDFGSHTP